MPKSFRLEIRRSNYLPISSTVFGAIDRDQNRFSQVVWILFRWPASCVWNFNLFRSSEHLFLRFHFRLVPITHRKASFLLPAPTLFLGHFFSRNLLCCGCSWGRKSILWGWPAVCACVWFRLVLQSWWKKSRNRIGFFPERWFAEIDIASSFRKRLLCRNRCEKRDTFEIFDTYTSKGHNEFLSYFLSFLFRFVTWFWVTIIGELIMITLWFKISFLWFKMIVWTLGGRLS